MKKFFRLVVVLLCFGSASIFALDDMVLNENESLEPSSGFETEREFLSLNRDKQDEFLENSLYVQTLSGKSRILFASDSSRPPYMNLFSYSADYDTLGAKWKPYLGYKEISKYEFFDLVGREDLKQKWIDVENARSHRYKVFMGVGGTITALGGVLGIVGAILHATTPYSLDVSLLPLYLSFFYIPSFALIATGAITMACWEINAPSFPDINIKFALNLSNQYNQNLLSRIKNSV